MEYAFIGLLLVLIPVVSVWTYKKGKKKGTDWLLDILFKSGFNAKAESFKKQNTHIKKGGIVFVGDSITQDYNVYEYYPQYVVYNRGIGGDTTEGLLRRMDESIFELNPEIVVLLMGTNDFGVLNASVEDVFIRMEKIVSLIQEKLPKTKIILQSVYPVNPRIDPISVGLRKNRDIKLLNEKYASINNIIYLDLYAKLIDDEGNLSKDYSVEGLHINATGYEKITSIISQLLKMLKEN